MKHSIKLLSAGALALLLLGGCGQNSVPMEEAKVELGTYNGIEVTVEQTEVTEEDINDMAVGIIDGYNQSLISQRKVVEDGDIVHATIYYYDEEENVVGGVEDNEHTIHLGAGEIYPEIESALVGAEVGGKVEADVTLAEPYETDESLFGTPVHAEVIVEGLREGDPVDLETMTDEQAKAVYDVDSVDAFYEALRTELEESVERYRSRQISTELMETLLESTAVDPFPGAELKTRMEDAVASLEDMAKTYYDMTFPEYCQLAGMTEKEYRETLKAQITELIKTELILQAVADAEDIQSDEESYEAYVKQCVEQYGYDSEEDFFKDYTEEEVKEACRQELTTKWLIDHAKITYVKPGELNDKPSEE